MDTGTTIAYYPLNSVRICIDEYQLPHFEGRAYSPLTEETIYFSDFNDLLLKLDAVFDKTGYPQAFQEKRSFQEKKGVFLSYKGIPKAKRRAEEILSCSGRAATCDVQVEWRRNTSWQGKVVKWKDETGGHASGEEISFLNEFSSENFHSEMELLNLLCSL